MAYIHELAVTLPRISLLDPTGVLDSSAPQSPAADFALKAYRHMWWTRLFDQRAINLQRTGQLGTYAACLGQEAVGTAIGLALDRADIFVPYYRDQATQLLRGVSMQEILRFWGGDERGSHYAQASRDLPNCIPIATQLSHAAGCATALKLRHEPQAVLSTCGDGATSRGDFYEALNLAGVWHLPLVIVVNNNQWAISVPLSAQTAAPTLAQKALAAGLPGVRVDGNDVFALHTVITEALQRARSGKGPTLVEAVTYRLCDHTTADDMSRYADPVQREAAQAQEPLKRLRLFLEAATGWTQAQQDELEAELNAQIENATQAYLAQPRPAPADIFDYLQAEPDADLLAQRASWLAGRSAS